MIDQDSILQVIGLWRLSLTRLGIKCNIFGNVPCKAEHQINIRNGVAFSYFTKKNKSTSLPSLIICLLTLLLKVKFLWARSCWTTAGSLSYNPGPIFSPLQERSQYFIFWVTNGTCLIPWLPHFLPLSQRLADLHYRLGQL